MAIYDSGTFSQVRDLELLHNGVYNYTAIFTREVSKDDVSSSDDEIHTYESITLASLGRFFKAASIYAGWEGQVYMSKNQLLITTCGL